MATTPRGSFSNANRHMQEEETLQLTSVGVDIGSSTSHLVRRFCLPPTSMTLELMSKRWERLSTTNTRTQRFAATK